MRMAHWFCALALGSVLSAVTAGCADDDFGRDLGNGDQGVTVDGGDLAVAPTDGRATTD